LEPPPPPLPRLLTNKLFGPLLRTASQAGGESLIRLRDEAARHARDAAEQLEELEQVKHQNTELRAKVIRQDAAWKRKIESERRRGHIIEVPEVHRRHTLGALAPNVQGNDNSAEGSKRLHSSGRVTGSELVQAMRRSGGARRASEEPQGENDDTAWA